MTERGATTRTDIDGGLLVLVPARNEGARLGRVLDGIRDVLGPVHVLVVDGASTDDTVERASERGARVVAQSGHGYAGALATGYREAAAMGASRVLQIDADGQHRVEDAPRLLAAASRSDLVVGTRARRPLWPSPHRAIGSAGLAALCRLAAGVHVRDATSGYWAAGPRCIGLFAARFPEDVADANVRVMVARAGLSIAEVPVEMAARDGGESMHGGWRGALNFLRAVRAVARAAR